MSDRLYDNLDALLSRLKGYEYRLDRALPISLILVITVRRFVWLLRGIVKCLLFQQRFVLIYMAPWTNLRNTRMVYFGRGVTLERGSIIDGLSRNGIRLGDNVVVGAYSVIRASSPCNVGEGVRIGSNSAVDAYSFIGASGFVSIGDNVIMGQHVSFHAENHNYDRTDVPIKNQGGRRLGIVVEDDCWVGSNTTLLDGCHVGRGCVIAAGSVVKGEIPPFSIIAGIPARVLRSRRDTQAENIDETHDLAAPPAQLK